MFCKVPLFSFLKSKNESCNKNFIFDRCCRSVLPADKEQQEKYDVEDNPVYAICGKSQHHKKRSSVAHEYETVVPATKDTCSS